MTAGEQQPSSDSIAALLVSVERVVDDERARGATLTSKAATLAGFSGTILSIVSVLGREGFKLDLARGVDVSLRVLFIFSVAALATAAALAIGGVLRTQARSVIDTEQVVAFASPPWIYTDRIDIDGNLLASLGIVLREDRRINDRRARLTDWAAIALLLGLLAVAAQGLILAVMQPLG